MLSAVLQIKSYPQTPQDFRRNDDTSLNKVELCPNLLKIGWGEGITARVSTQSAIRCQKNLLQMASIPLIMRSGDQGQVSGEKELLHSIFPAQELFSESTETQGLTKAQLLCSMRLSGSQGKKVCVMRHMVRQVLLNGFDQCKLYLCSSSWQSCASVMIILSPCEGNRGGPHWVGSGQGPQPCKYCLGTNGQAQQ